jgi:hypothetical protein
MEPERPPSAVTATEDGPPGAGPQQSRADLQTSARLHLCWSSSMRKIHSLIYSDYIAIK